MTSPCSLTYTSTKCARHAQRRRHSAKKGGSFSKPAGQRCLGACAGVQLAQGSGFLPHSPHNNASPRAMQVFNIACFTHHGSVAASEEWGSAVRRRYVRPSRPGSYEVREWLCVF